MQGRQYDNTFVEVRRPTASTTTRVGGRGYIDLNASYKVSEGVEVFGKINNLLDNDPPATPNIIAQTIYANAPFYDRTGRYYIGGVRVRF